METLVKSSNGQWKIKEDLEKKDEILEKPPVSEAQRKAMHAAASGKSQIGIPQSVGKEFADKDPGGKLPERVSKEEDMDKNTGPVSYQGNGNLGGSTLMRAEELKMSERGQWSIEKADKPKIKSGFFTVDHLNAMDKAPSHQDAKSIAHAAIESQPNAHPENKAKAKMMVDGSKSKKHLMIGAANFMLAHPSEDLGMKSDKK